MTDAFAPLKENAPYESLSITCDMCGKEIATDDALLDCGPSDVTLPALVTTATRIHNEATGHDSVTIDATRQSEMDSIDVTVEI